MPDKKNKYTEEFEKFEGKRVEVTTFSLEKIRGICLALSKEHINVILESEEKDEKNPKKFIKTTTLFKNIQAIKRYEESKQNG